ncbi:MAG: hypothetical protein AAGF98_00545 [Cyanobacteria bacterium P01_H01_bin.153]
MGNSSAQLDLFAVDSQLVRLLPRAGASFRNPDVNLPILRADSGGYYLEMRVDADPEEISEVGLTRRIPLEDLSREAWQELKKQYDNIDLEAYLSKGIKGLEKIEDMRVRRLTATLLTFLNPRQVELVLYLYRAASVCKTGPIAKFRSNDLLEVMGYSRTKDGGFHANIRSQLHCDLMALHRTELVYAEETETANGIVAEVTIKNILRIQKFKVDNVQRDFDTDKAADYTYGSADEYVVNLEFFQTPTPAGGDYVLFGNIDMQQRVGGSANHNYGTKLLMYLASRLKWDSPKDGQYLTISRRHLFKNLDLFGSNTSRNSTIFWRTVEELKEKGFLLNACEVPGKRKNSVLVEFQLNTDKIRISGDSHKI